MQCKGIPTQHKGSAEGWDYKEGTADQQCYENGHLTEKQRSSNYPFSDAKEVRIISFRDDQNPLEDSMYLGNIRESIKLSATQINDLTHILYNFNYTKNTTSKLGYSGFCYLPRHAIMFYNAAGKLFAYMEYCFECTGNRRSSEKVVMGDFCQGKYDLLRMFFKERGIKYFGESKETDPNLR